MKYFMIAARLLGAAVFGSVSVNALSQTPIDAGALQQQIERERLHQMPKHLIPDKPAAPTAMKSATGLTLTVSQFRFSGNTLLSDEQLAPVVAAYLGRPLDFAQLQAAAMAVAGAYRAAGWVVNAYLPQQDIRDGIVTIQIVEAVFGKLLREGPQASRVDAGSVDALFAGQHAPGAVLDADALDRALLLADDLPGITVAGSLVAGSREGETDLILRTADAALLVGEAAIDNTGARATGSGRLSASLNFNSPLHLGDLLSTNVIHTRGSDYLRLGYTLPAGSDGWRLGLNASEMHYRLITLDSDKNRGSSSVVGLEAAYPVLRSRLANLFLNLNADHKYFDNQFGGEPTNRYTIDSVTMALNGNLFDNFAGGGANSISIAWVGGRRGNRIGTTSEQFYKLRASLTRQQVISNELTFLAQLSGQKADKTLDTSERFYLGGAYGVRAYPSNEGGGSSGVMSNLELRLKLPEGFVLTAFHDYGHVSSDGAMSYSLQGAGLSLAWQVPLGVNLKATWAHRLGNNPNPITVAGPSYGDDQDGSLVRNRLWLSAALPF